MRKLLEKNKMMNKKSKIKDQIKKYQNKARMDYQMLIGR